MTISAVYGFASNGRANRLLVGPDLNFFPEPAEGEIALLVSAEIVLPGWIAGGQYYPVPPAPNNSSEWDWDLKQWVASSDEFDRLVAQALASVDNAAGAARLRYITSVPGQAETYIRKEQQARTWAASGYTGAAPSFIAAEATALGLDPQDVADEIIATADDWENGKGPEIEAARLQGKAAVRAATTESALSAAELAAIAALQAI